MGLTKVNVPYRSGTVTARERRERACADCGRVLVARRTFTGVAFQVAEQREAWLSEAVRCIPCWRRWYAARGLR